MAKLIRVWDGTVWQSVGSALPNALTIDGTQTLTNKTISGASNTLTNIPNNALILVLLLMVPPFLWAEA